MRTSLLLLLQLCAALHFPTPRFYVMSLRPAMNSALIQCFKREFGNFPWLMEAKEVAQNTAEIYVHTLSLQHPRRSTTHRHADVILVPFYGFLSSKVESCAGTRDHSHRVQILAEFLVQQLPKFDPKSRLALVVGFFFPIHESERHSAIHGQLSTVLQGAVLAVYEKYFDARGEEGTHRRLMLNQTVVIPYVPNTHIYAGGDPAIATRTSSFFFRGSAQLGYRTSPGRKLRQQMMTLFQSRKGADISTRYIASTLAHDHTKCRAHITSSPPASQSLNLSIDTPSPLCSWK
jgi:hypothetical protein